MLSITTGAPIMRFFEGVVEDFVVMYLAMNPHVEAVVSGSNVPVRACQSMFWLLLATYFWRL
jgi:hypothetical protein